MAAINVALFRGRVDEALCATEATIAAAHRHQVDRISMFRLYLANLQARVLDHWLDARTTEPTLDELLDLVVTCPRWHEAAAKAWRTWAFSSGFTTSPTALEMPL